VAGARAAERVCRATHGGPRRGSGAPQGNQNAKGRNGSAPAFPTKEADPDDALAGLRSNPLSQRDPPPGAKPGKVNPNLYCKGCGQHFASQTHKVQCGHAHRWKIEAPNGSISGAHCAIEGCDKTARFANSNEGLAELAAEASA